MTQGAVRVSGKCKTWENGFGFITRDDGQGDVFVHYKEIIKQGFKSLRVGDALEFEVDMKPDGNTRAIRVTGIGGTEVSPPSQNQEILYGTCKTWSTEKGFGFVTRSDGEGDVFVHRSEVKKKEPQTLTIGEFVQFELHEYAGRTHAVNVKEVLSNSQSSAQNIFIDPNQTLIGTCKAWGKGFGFIKRNDGGPDVFVHQTEVVKSGFRSLTVGEQVWFKVERKSDGNTRAVKVTTSEPRLDITNQDKNEQLDQGLFQFHPQQILLDQFPITYRPEQLPFHPQIPEGNTDNWKKMIQWTQPGFYSCYTAQSYQNQGNFWGGICLSTVAKKAT